MNSKTIGVHIKMDAKTPRWSLSVILVIVALYGVQSVNITLPCNRSDPEVSECVRKFVLTLRPFLREGGKFVGVIALEPLRLDQLITDYKLFRNKDYRLTITNVTARGMSDVEIPKYRISRNATHFNMELLFSEINAVAQYELTGTKGKSRIYGCGPMRLQLRCARPVLDLDFFARNVNGTRTMQFSNFKMDLTVEGGSVTLDNLNQIRGKRIRPVPQQRIDRMFRKFLRNNFDDLVRTSVGRVVNFMNQLLVENPLLLILQG